MKNVIALVALFGMTTGLAGAGEHPVYDWDRVESVVSPTGYVGSGGTPATVQNHPVYDWDRIESVVSPTGYVGSGGAPTIVRNHPVYDWDRAGPELHSTGRDFASAPSAKSAM
jgi:hypothetical protein